MAFLKKDWSYKFEMVYKTFCSVAASKDMKATNKTFCDFLNISTGKLQKWSKGQWPSAEDLETIHDKLGFSYSWLVTGEGDPFEESFIPYPTPDDTAELMNLRHENSDLKGIAEIIIGKQRNGPIGTVRLTFNGQWSRFDNYAGPQYDDE